jgi:Lrp/AsnC family leucine-responsive transcriptional regulator
MAAEITVDRTDWRLLEELQRDGRASYADLARVVAMSASAVAERVRRLEEAGVIAGYRATVDPVRVGLDVMAFVRLRYPTGNYRPFHALLDSTPEIVEAHHVTGEDCFVLKVVAGSMRHLEEVTGRIAGLGSVTTSVVYSSPLTGRAINPTQPPQPSPSTRRPSINPVKPPQPSPSTRPPSINPVKSPPTTD